jgi:hypothetical protein
MSTNASRLGALAGFVLAAAALAAQAPAGAAAPPAPAASPPLQDEPASIVFSWKSVPGASFYLVELKDSAERSLPSVQAKGTTVSISVPPGDYLIRVVCLDGFRRPEGASPWKKVIVVRKGQPAVDSLAPGRVEPGSALPLVVTGRNIDAETAATLRKGGVGAPILPLSVRELGAGRVEFDFPRLSEIARYSLELDNKPDYSLVLPDCVAVSHDPARVLAIEPRILDLLTAGPLKFSLRADKVVQGASIELVRGGESYAPTLSSRDEGSLALELPPGLPEGDYDLVIENDALSIATTPSALRLVLPPPAADSVTPASIEASSAETGAENGQIEVRGKDFAPELKASLANGGTETELEVTQVEPGRAVVSLPPDLAAGSYDLRLSNAASPAADPEAPAGSKDALLASALEITAPPPPVVEQAPQAEEAQAVAAEPTEEAGAAPAEAAAPPEQASPEPAPAEAAALPPAATEGAPPPAPEPAPASTAPATAKSATRIVLPLDLEVAWEYGFVLGNDWQPIYSSTPAVAELLARLCLWNLRVSGWSKSWELGAELGARASNFAFSGDSGTYVDSSLAAYGLELGPCLTLPLFSARMSLGIDGGMAYSRASESGSAASLDSFDPMLACRLELGYLPSPRLSLGVSASFRYVFYLDAGMPEVSVGAAAGYRF